MAIRRHVPSAFLPARWSTVAGIVVCLAGGSVAAAGSGDPPTHVGIEWSLVPVATGWEDSTAIARGVTHVVAGGPGFVAVGGGPAGSDGPEWQTVLFTSPDGATWSAVEAGRTFRDAHIVDIAAGGPGLVAIGQTGTMGEGFVSAATAWVSRDGVRWERVDRPGYAPVFMEAVAAGPGGLVALGGARCSIDGCSRSQGWRSAGGRRWTSIAMPDVVVDDIVGGDAYLAFRRYGGWAPERDVPATGLLSVDGRRWDEVPMPFLRLAARTDTGYVGVGVRGDANPSEEEPLLSIWTSPDGRSWTEAFHPTLGMRYATAVVPLGTGALVVGGSFEEAAPAILVGSPDGVAWSEWTAGSMLAGPAASDGERVVVMDPGPFAWVSPQLADPPLAPTVEAPPHAVPDGTLAGSWVTGPASPRSFEDYDQALALPDGRVLMLARWPRRTQGAIFDPAAGTWTAITPKRDRDDVIAAAVGADGRAYAFGRIGGIFAYDPAADRWERRGQLRVAPRGAATTGQDGRIYLFGGEATCCDPDRRRVVRWDPATGRTRLLAPFPGSAPEGEGIMRAVTLPDGRFLLVDRHRMWTYDPASDTWAPGLAWPRDAGRSIVALPDGRLAALRDACDGVRPATRLILVDPATGTWHDGPELPAPMEIALLAPAGPNAVGVFGGYTIVPAGSGCSYSDDLRLPGPLLLSVG